MSDAVSETAKWVREANARKEVEAYRARILEIITPMLDAKTFMEDFSVCGMAVTFQDADGVAHRIPPEEWHSLPEPPKPEAEE